MLKPQTVCAHADLSVPRDPITHILAIKGFAYREATLTLIAAILRRSRGVHVEYNLPLEGFEQVLTVIKQ